MDPTTYGLGQILTSPLVLIGLALILGGGSALVWMYRDVLGYYEPEIPPVVQPPVEQTYIHPEQDVAANYWRADTDVIPRIPGATPTLSPQLAAVARMLDAVDRDADETAELTPIAGLREERIEERTEEDWAGVIADHERQIRAAYGLAPKSSDETQVVDLCPLTTQDIAIPTVGDIPVHRAIADREPTQELSKTVAKILEATK